MIDVEIERPKFEARMVAMFPMRSILIDERGRFEDDYIDAAWDGWLAAKRDADKGE